MDDTDNSLAAVLGYLVGRPLKLREILEALEISRTSYYSQIQEERSIRPDNLVRAAVNRGINEVDLLARFNLIRNESILDYADSQTVAANFAITSLSRKRARGSASIVRLRDRLR
jgi:hypothetical protein